MAVVGELAVTARGWITSPAVAEVPVPLDGELALALAAAAARRLEAARVRLRRGALALDAAGWVRAAGRRVAAAEVTLTLAPGDCRAHVDALPPRLRGPLDELVVRGTLAGRGRLAFDLDDRPAPTPRVARGSRSQSSDLRGAVADPPAPIRRSWPAPRPASAFPGGARGGRPRARRLGRARDPARPRPRRVGGGRDARFCDHRGFDLDRRSRRASRSICAERRFARARGGGDDQPAAREERLPRATVARSCASCTRRS
ncbi:MAG: hypothetical protein HS111_36060 [Kofleriaceae bacterium]|nr:hypothetical protein [Kofleriaceae bacterium]